MLEQRLERDLKAALLSGDHDRVTLLRGLKSALLYAKVAEGKRAEGLSDDATIAVLAKEAKKRQESADLYLQGGNQARADAELAEKAIIEKYLPPQLSADELRTLIDGTVQELGATGMGDMGRVIAAVKAKTTGSADGGTIARLVKERLG